MLDQLAASGAPVDMLIKRSGLRRFSLGNVDGYVPVHRLYRLFDEVVNYTGNPNLADMFSEQYRLANLGNWGQQLAACPDMLTACLGAEQYDSNFQSNQRIWLEIQGPRAKLHNIYIDPPSAGRTQTELLSLVIMLDGFRQFAGPKWVPQEIHTRDASLEEIEPILPVGKSMVWLNQSSFGFVFPTAALAQPRNAVKASGVLKNIPHPGDTLAERIEQLTESMDFRLLPGLQCVADLFDSSPRTLQRQLAAENTSFSQVLDGWRFKAALRLLDDPRMTIREISQTIGYANTPNFERAFRRWTHTSAQRYRDSHGPFGAK
jgi:AraC-like DNA-binding protein